MSASRRQVLAATGAALALSAGCARAASHPPPPRPLPMRRGINLGNALEAEYEGEWGYRIEEAHFDAIAGAGFDGVRIPVRWDAHAGARAPYTINPAFMARVAQVIDQAVARGLKVQLDVHHYAALNSAPHAERARYLAIWRQIARHFAEAPDTLIFEPLNEPNGPAWLGNTLRHLQAQSLRAIRESNPTRLVVFGGPDWNSIDGLRSWEPPDDLHIAVTVHYYEPHNFTHQNAEWLGSDAPRYGREWGTPDDIAAVQRHTEVAARYAAQRGVALQLGEFGVNRRVSLPQRAAWTSVVRRAFEAQDAAWCFWDFAGTFGLWENGAVNPALRAALFD